MKSAMTKMAMYLKVVGIFCLAIVPISHCYDDIDAFMTGDQIRQIFQADAGSVPLHEVVEINFPERNKRDLLPAGTRFTVRAFGENIKLWLHPREKVLIGDETPFYWAKYGPNSPGKVQFIPEYDSLRRVGQLLEDPKHLASLVIGRKDSGNVRVTGHIGKKRLAIKPLPRGVVTEYLRKRRSIDNFDSSNSTFHVVYRTKENFEQNHSIAAIDHTILRERIARSTKEIPRVLYPELLIFIEYSIYNKHKSNMNGFLEYLLAFWNGVDLKYRTLETPKVRLHISAIVIALEPRGTPYISNQMIKGEENAFSMRGSYADSMDFFYVIKDTFSTKSYDIAVTMTELHIWDKGYGTVGYSYPGGVCNVDEVTKLMRAVTMCHDDGAFMGVYITAHELGHSLGLGHDDKRDRCFWRDGYIMAFTPVHTKNSGRFSECSIEQLQRQLDNQRLTCLYNEPKIFGKDMPRLMPGKMKNLEAQCRERGYGLPCNVTAVDVCVNYYCLESNGSCKNILSAPLDGTSCGDENEIPFKFCLQNECVHLRKNAKKNAHQDSSVYKKQMKNH